MIPYISDHLIYLYLLVPTLLILIIMLSDRQTPLYVPDVLLFGFGGITLTPGLMLISSDHVNDRVLHSHEADHAKQMLREGWEWRGKKRLGYMIFWWCYITDIDYRRAREVEACKAGHATDPSKTWYWAQYLAWELELFGSTATGDQKTVAKEKARVAIEGVWIK